jgi:hypothetical protein
MAKICGAKILLTRWGSDTGFFFTADISRHSLGEIIPLNHGRYSGLEFVVGVGYMWLSDLITS